MKTPEIILSQDAEENGLALILGDLIRQNIESNPALAGDLRRVNRIFAVTARDEDSSVQAFLKFEGNRLTISGAGREKSDVEITGSYEAILSLSKTALIFGLPNPANVNTAAVLKKIAFGEIRICGLIHLAPILRLLRLIAVN